MTAASPSSCSTFQSHAPIPRSPGSWQIVPSSSHGWSVGKSSSQPPHQTSSNGAPAWVICTGTRGFRQSRLTPVGWCTRSRILPPASGQTTTSSTVPRSAIARTPSRSTSRSTRDPSGALICAPEGEGLGRPERSPLLVRLRPRGEVRDQVSVRATDARRDLLRRRRGLLSVHLSRHQELRLGEVRVRVELPRDEVLEVRRPVLDEVEEHLLLRDLDQLRVEAVVGREGTRRLE